MDITILRKYFSMGILLLLIILSIFVLKPFLLSIITALILAYIFYPIYLRINKSVKKDFISSIITIFLVLLIIGLPMFLVLNTIINQTYTAYLLAKKGILSESSLFSSIEGFSPQIKAILLNGAEKTATNIINSSTEFIINLPKMILNFFIMMFVMFYAFMQGKEFLNYLFSFVPMKERHKKHIYAKFQKVINSLIYGIIVVGILQGIFGILGFYIFNIPSPLFWGTIMAILSMLPAVGTWLIWVPAIFIKMTGDSILSGLGLMLYGGTIVLYFEGYLKPKLVGKRADIHPLVVLLGVFGGIALFGLIGVVLGPLILVLSLTFLKISRKEMK